MQDPVSRFGTIASIAALLPLMTVAAQAQSPAALVSLHGSMTTSANITDKFVFRVPAATSSLTIRVPIPSPPANPADQTALTERESVGDVSVSENKRPDSVTSERDTAGNLYRVLSYQHVGAGMITVSTVMSDVRLDADLDDPLPDATLPLQWMPPSVERYLSSTQLVQSDDERVALLARRIVGTSRSEADAARAISLWLEQRIGYSMNMSTERRTDAVSTMLSGQGICEGWAHLFLALARASGIPCRYVGGYTIGGDISYPLSPSGNAKVEVFTPTLPHAWVEVWYPGAGWVPYDPQTSAGFVDTHHVPIWTGLDGNSNLPLLTWQSSPANDTLPCSFAEQESTSDTWDNMRVFCDSDASYEGSGANYVFSR